MLLEMDSGIDISFGMSKGEIIMDFSIFLPPVIGGVIGYITNDVAIKMLFHPRKPIYIGKWQLPFTPGLIPKEKHRVAKSIGRVVSEQLLNPDTLSNALTSPDILEKLRAALEKFVEDNRTNEDTVDATLLRFAPAEVVDLNVDNIKTSLKALICSKLENMHFGEMASKHLLQKLNQSLGGAVKGYGFGLLDESLINVLAGNVGELLDKGLNDHSEEIVNALVDNEADKLLCSRICDIIEKYDEKIPSLINWIIRTYVSIIDSNLEQLLKGVDLGKIVEEKIATFDVAQLEDMIFGIMNKELKAIVYLGALLGFLMGWITPLIGG